MMAKKIAVTGGLSSGKSTVCQLFKEFGAYVVNADEIVHQLLSVKTAAGQQVVELFGIDILTSNEIDRSKIAKKAFDNPTLIQALEDLLHPIVYNEIEREYQRVSTSTPLFIAEIPLLFETGAEKNYSATIAVKANSDECERRFIEKRKCKNEEYRQRMIRQMSVDEKAARATYVIDNDCSLDELKVAVAKLYKLLSTP